MDEALITVGRFARAHGIKGWITIHSDTDPVDKIVEYQPWIIHWQDRDITIHVEQARSHGAGVVVKLPECGDRTTAMTYTNCEIKIKRSQLEALPENEYYWSDLIGLSVHNDDNRLIGEVDHLLETGANDVLVVCGRDKTETLIPFLLGDVIKLVDLQSRRIDVCWAGIET